MPTETFAPATDTAPASSAPAVAPSAAPAPSRGLRAWVRRHLVDDDPNPQEGLLDLFDEDTLR